MRITLEDIERFNRGVEVRGPDECWPWIKSLTDRGYGKFWCDGKNRRAHRVAFIIKNGPVPDDIVVRHTCDNPPCCNHKHLLSGTHAENIHDRDMRGRTSRHIGESNPMAILTESQVLEIRKLVSDGMKQNDVGKLFGIGQVHVSNIATGKIWSHLPTLPHRSKTGPY